MVDTVHLHAAHALPLGTRIPALAIPRVPRGVRRTHWLDTQTSGEYGRFKYLTLAWYRVN